ncbi:MAG: hypothetical protein H7A25_14285 [Leptospiraceae bacterium]|nr:hypothetical protein [Leptospiraceae bacterium]MCP5501072.1 hypothetical protein [Leptospiraceae bacterium]
MQHYEVRAEVAEDGSLKATLPQEIEPGSYTVVIVLDEKPDSETPEAQAELQVRLKRMEENPHNGYTRKDIEESLGGI